MPRRDDKIPLDVLRRVMPKPLPDPNEPPRDPTLLETLTDSFRIEQAKTAGDISTRIKDDGKRRA